MKILPTILLLAVIPLSCKTNPVKQEKKLPLLEFYYSNSPYESIRMEFININSVKIYHHSIFFSDDTLCAIEPADQQKLTGFIQVLTQNKNDESYFETHPTNVIVEEGHSYNFTINTDSVHKTISISGHSAPGWCYDFADWVRSLRYKLDTKR